MTARGWATHGGDGFISCPQCAAPADVREKSAATCHTWETIASGGASYFVEADEVLVIVEVICVAGHRFAGPIEMLDGVNEIGSWEELTA